MLEDRNLPQPDKSNIPPDHSLDPGLTGNISEDWRDTRALTLQKISPGKSSDAGRDLRRYLFVASISVIAGLMLALADERFKTPHLTTAASVLMLIVVMTSLAAIYQTRKTAEGIARAVAPSMRDLVTDLPDEEYFRLRLRDEYKRMHRYGTTLSLAVFDVNNLASVNEAYGEAVGDAVLRHIADLLEMTKRASDVAVRLSDDEFALMLLECSQEDAMKFLGRLERYITRRPVTVNVDGQAITLWVGVCSGVASAREGDTNPPDLLAEARHNLDTARADRDRRRERWTSSTA